MADLKQYTEKEDIEKIINLIKKFKDKLHFTDHYWFGITKRNIDHELILETFPKFELVSFIEEEILKFGDKGYELFYSLSKNRTLSIAFCINQKESRLDIIHAVIYNRKIDKRIKSIKIS